MPRPLPVAGHRASAAVTDQPCQQSAPGQVITNHRQLIKPDLNGHESQHGLSNGTSREVSYPANGTSVDDLEWSGQYDRSVTNIQDHIYAVAGAVAILDSIEHKTLAIRCELQRIRDTNLRIDCDKVIMALQLLTDYVNDAIKNVDGQCVNLLRDAKLEINFAELGAAGGQGSGEDQSSGVSLTMISIQGFLDNKIRKALADGMVEEELPEFIDEVCTIISSNIQILTSIMLALFATRDYTQAVTRLAARENIIPAIETGADEQLSLSTVNRMQFGNIDKQLDTGRRQLKEGRASLTELLEHVRSNPNDADVPFGNTKFKEL